MDTVERRRGGFQPGHDPRRNLAGKPKGPNKKTADVKAVAGQHTDEAIAVLVRVMHDDTAPHAARVAAARELLDRAVGRPSQAIEQKIEKVNVRDMSDEELLAIAQGSGDGDSDPEEGEGRHH